MLFTCFLFISDVIIMIFLFFRFFFDPAPCSPQSAPCTPTPRFRNTHFIICHVPKYSHDSWSISAALARGFSDPLTILKEEKALGTRLDLTGLALQGKKSDQSKVGPGPLGGGVGHWANYPIIFLGVYSRKIWVWVCSALLETLTLFQTKLCDFPYPIPDSKFDILFQTCPGSDICEGLQISNIY